MIRGPQGRWRMAQILAVINRSLREQGRAPTVREIGEMVGLTSSSTVQLYLRDMVAEGMLRAPARGTTRGYLPTVRESCPTCGSLTAAGRSAAPDTGR